MRKIERVSKGVLEKKKVKGKLWRKKDSYMNKREREGEKDT